MIDYHSESRWSLEKPTNAAVILLSFFIALALNMLPYRDLLFSYKPDFVALLLVYWLMHRERLINYAAAFVLGLMSDLAYAATLGQHALAYAVIALMVNSLRSRFVVLDLWQQAVNVFIVLAAGQATLFAVSYFIEDAELHWRHFLPCVVGAAMWFALPALIGILRNQLQFVNR